MEKEQLIELFQNYLDENGRYQHFTGWLSEREGLTMTDLGFED
ncbi:hypothetical protein [Zunongwangia profunda]|nr:hypothetical protein [Zunongwangia profunda]|tara:strand:+ start:10423 stop:10551 length:129 start_codon:yes stop_codon:yes gene_type:complete